MQEHAQIGRAILDHHHSPLMKMASIIAYTHHEKYDGSGYPQGLIAQEIPIEGRIAAICDVYDALTSDRVYKKHGVKRPRLII
jgi:putative two-component system response regulator